MKKEIVVGLFGTCGKSTFRKEILIPGLSLHNIKYFNPQVEDWTPELATIEADNLASNPILLFPITGETYGTGSLAETGFSVIQALKFDDRRHVIVFVDNELNQELMENKELARESLRARALVITHLKKLNLPNVHLVNSIDEMLEATIKVHAALKILASI